MREIQIYIVAFAVFGLPMLFAISECLFPRKPKRQKQQQLPPLYSSVHPATRKPEKPEKLVKQGPSPETLEAMHVQADAERAIAEALERKAQYISDPVKRARIEKQAANSWVRFNSILDKLDKLESSE